MRKTTFAGLTVLGPEDSFFADGAAFTTRDRDEIDRGIKIGAKTHRHTGLPGLSDPAPAASALVVASGGSIDSGLTVTVGYTLEDEEGGETLISPLIATSSPVPLDVPLSAPIATTNYTLGSLLTDTYTYGITYTDGEGGETPLGPTTLVTREPGFGNAQIELSGLTAGLVEAGAKGWRLFRARGGGEFALLATGDETKDEFIDDGSLSPDCSTHPPTDNQNNTNQISSLVVTIPSGLASGATFINLYATTSGSFAESSLLAQYPIASAGAIPVFRSLEFLDSQPPDVNRSYGGADQIDPDSELLDWHWKRPVAASGLLPASNEAGDVRLVLDTSIPYLGDGAGGWSELTHHVASRRIKTGTEHPLIVLDDCNAVDYEADQNAKVLIPSDAAVNIPVGTVVHVSRLGSGSIGMSASAGVTLRSKGGASAVSAQWGVAFLRKLGADDWLLYGDIA